MVLQIFFARFGKKDEVIGEEKVRESWATFRSFYHNPILEVNFLLDKVCQVLHAENEDVRRERVSLPYSS